MRSRGGKKRKTAEEVLVKELTPEQQKLAEKEAKELEKHATAKEKQAAKLAGRAEKKEFNVRKAQAWKIALKLHQTIKNLQGCLADTNILHVIAFTVNFTKASLKGIQDIPQECDVKKGEEKPAPISVDLAAVGEMYKKTAIGSKDVLDFIAVIASQRSRVAK